MQSFITRMARTISANPAFSVESRLERWILMADDRAEGSDLPLTEGFLATVLGVRRPGITVAMHMPEGKGLIRNTRGRMTVLDRAELMGLPGGAY